MAISNSQYDAIMRTYRDKQTKALEEQLARTRYVIENVPGFKELDDSIASFAVSQTKKLLSGDKEAYAETEATIDNLTKMKRDLLIGSGYGADYLDIVYECPDCKDTGYIGNEKCHCLRQAINAVLYQQSNIEAVLKETSFDKLSYDYYQGEDLEHFKNAVSHCEKFVENFQNDYENLLFYGSVGTGKSFLSGCIARELINRNYNVIYFSSTELFRQMSDIMFDRGDRSELNSKRDDLYSSDLLIIDDLGTELSNSAVASQLFSLLNERALKQKSTIISTNLDLRELQERYQDRIFSRLLERYSFFKISGPDIRRIKRYK